MEHVVGVVLGFDLGQPPVGFVAVGLADTARIVVGVEEVDVDAGAVGLQGVEECSGPRGLRCPDGVVLLGEPDCVDDDVVVDIAPRVGRGFPRGWAIALPMWNIAAYDLGEVARWAWSATMSMTSSDRPVRFVAFQ